MKELGPIPIIQDVSFNSYHHHFGGPSPLETLPEEDSDIDDEDFRSDRVSLLTPDYLWAEGESKLRPTIRHEIERQRAKVQLLESTIGQLQEELRDSKDQNELLEFRLLELGDFEGGTSTNQNIRGKRCSRRKSVDSEEGSEGGSSSSQAAFYETEVSSPEVTHNDDRSNGHSCVTEARSSCSDCSESLSFQESGIFEDACTTGRPGDDELGRLMSQLEELIGRFSEPKGKVKGEPDLGYELVLCRQRLQDFDRKLRHHGNHEYIQSLETKVALLLNESQKLEEEKADLEETQNESRTLCQSYDEKLKRTKLKKRTLSSELSRQLELVHDLKLELGKLEELEVTLTNRVQMHEQQMFELEESNMELRDSVQFLMQSIPALLVWFSWRHRRGQRSCQPPPALLPFTPPASTRGSQTDPEDLRSPHQLPRSQCQNYSPLQEEWDTLIKALDEFEIQRRPEPGPKLKLKGTLVANRIRSLFPTEIPTSPQSPMEPEPTKIFKATTQLQQKLRDYVTKRTKSQTYPAEPESLEQIMHLTSENNRLKTLLHTEEQRWVKVQKLEEDNAQLRGVLTTSAVELRMKLEDSRKYAQRMMNRVEELEQTELIWTDKLKKKELEERKLVERIDGLRTENQFLMERVSRLEDQVEAKGQVEAALKQEVTTLQQNVTEALAKYQDKDETMSRFEAEWQDQLSNLERDLGRCQSDLGDSECSNGMLREEVLYFEKTLSEVTEKADENEKLVQILNSKIDQLSKWNLDLKRELVETKTFAHNDLEPFAKNEGGLRGVCWHVQDAMASIEGCTLCKSTAGPKLHAVSQSLNSLTMMLEGSQTTEDPLCTLSLSRCESEEMLTTALVGSSPRSILPPSWTQTETSGLRHTVKQLEAELVKKQDEIRKMSEKQKILSSQLKVPYEIRLRRENELRDSHLNESWWWKGRCDEKNQLIQILAKHLTILSASDIHGGPFDRVLKDIRKVDGFYGDVPSSNGNLNGEETPVDTKALLSYFELERTRIRDLLQCNDSSSSDLDPSPTLDFRVLRRISEDALLVSWSTSGANRVLHEGYEISVNGENHVQVPAEGRCRAVLSGLNMTEPLQLTLKVDGMKGQETSITYLA